MVEGEFSDAKSKMTGLMYREGKAGDALPYLAEELPRQLHLFDTFLGEMPWFAGDHITISDFLMREFLDCGILFSGNPNLLTENYSGLSVFKTKFDALPEIASYLSSEAVRSINNQHAKFR